MKFDDDRVETDIHSIQNNYFGLVEAIQKVLNPSVLLLKWVQLVNNIYVRVIEKRQRFKFYNINTN